MSLISLSQFISRWEGKGLDFDGAYGDQCVDLFRFYVRDVLGQPQPKGVTGAKDFWTNYEKDPNLHSFFSKIPNTPDGVPKKGDVVIWGAEYGKFGHIAIVISATVNQLTTFSQNDPTGVKSVRKIYRTYKGVLGWFSPKQKETVSENDMIVSKKTFEELVTKSTRYDALVSAGVSVPADVQNLNRIVQEANDSARIANDEAKNTRETLANYRKAVALRLDSPQDLDRVLAAIDELIAQLDRATKNSKIDEEKNREYENQVTKLDGEVKRLKLLLANDNFLKNVSTTELIQELLTRLSNILKGSHDKSQKS